MIIGVYNNEEEKKMLKEKCDRLSSGDLDKIKNRAKPGETYLFTDIYALNLSIVGISSFFTYMKKKNVKIDFVEKKEFEDIDVELFFEKASYIYSRISSQKSRESLQNARENGVVNGRPKISKEKALKIRELYEKKYTMREISETCEVSLGTVYKYCRKAQ